MYTSPCTKCSPHQAQPECESCGEKQGTETQIPFLKQNFSHYAFTQQLHGTVSKQKRDLFKIKCIGASIQDRIQGVFDRSRLGSRRSGQEQQTIRFMDIIISLASLSQRTALFSLLG